MSQLNVNGKTVVNPKEIASNLNNFFVNIEPSTESNIPKVGNINPAKFMKDRQQFNFIIAHISEEEVLGIINALENKSTGPTSIPTKLLKMIPDLIIIPLCRIINMSFINGVFPDNLKIVKVIPVHKGGSTQDMNNFCPISLLSIFDKIMEKLMHKRLYDFLENNNILFKNQFGFRKNNSTIFALLQITEKIGSLKSNPDYRCSRCKGTARPIDGRPHNEWLLVQDKKLDVVDSFCYLGDTIGAGGGCDLSVITRIRSAWGKFRELLPILTSRALSYITRGQIYSTYIRTVLLYASECWAPNVNDLLKLQRNDRAMIRWTCNVRLKDHISSDSLLRKLGINNIQTLL